MDTFLSQNNIDTLFKELQYFVKTQNSYDLNIKYVTKFSELCSVLYEKQKEYINSLEDFNSEVRSRIFPFITNSILNRKKNNFNTNSIENQLNCENADGNRIVPQNSNFPFNKKPTDKPPISSKLEPVTFEYAYTGEEEHLYNNLSDQEKIGYNDKLVNDILTKYNSTEASEGSAASAGSAGSSASAASNSIPDPDNMNGAVDSFQNYNPDDTYFQQIQSDSVVSDVNNLTQEEKKTQLSSILENQESCELNSKNKKAPKINSTIVLDSKILSSDDKIEEIECDLAGPLIVSHVTDIFLEFLSLHNLKTENGLSIENCHNFVLTLFADGLNINSYSNNANLVGKYILPNESFGLQDLETDYSFTLSGTTVDSSTTVTFTNFSGSEGNSAPQLPIKGMTVSGTGVVAGSKVVSVTNTDSEKSVTLDTAANDGATSNITFTQTSSSSSFKSTIVKLKSNYMTTIGQYVDVFNQEFQNFSFTLEGLVAGENNPSVLKAVNGASRVQVGLFFKAR